MDETLEKCSLGVVLDSECHLKHYVKKSAIIHLRDHTQEEQTLLLIRSKSPPNSINPELATICLHHQALFLTQFKSLQGKKCCNPFDFHKDKKKRAKGKSSAVSP